MISGAAEQSLQQRQKWLLRELRRRLPPEMIIVDPVRCRVYECDGFTARRQLPWCVLVPGDYQQLRTMLGLCSDAGIPVVARGAGTSLSGGATPVSGGVVISLARFTRILAIDSQACTATVQAGVCNLDVSRAASSYGLFYAPDPSSQSACTIGGNIAENAGGVHCLKYGLTTHNLIAVRGFTITGEKIETAVLEDAGPTLSLLPLLTGSEGMLAVLTEAVLKLTPLPQSVDVFMAAFGSVEDAANAVAAVIAAGILPAGMEIMDAPCVAAVNAYLGDEVYPTRSAAVLLCELDGSSAEVSHVASRIRQIFNSHSVTSVSHATDAAGRARLWAGRKAAFPAVGRIAPDYLCMDGSIPRSALASTLDAISAAAAEADLQVANVFHAGDGNLHPLILYDASHPGEMQRAEKLGGVILELCLAAGGSITGEHGVGVEKLDQMCHQFSAAELEVMHGIKQAFDPHGLLNPGKAVPQLRRCSELGGMHVHRGQLPLSHLERF